MADRDARIRGYVIDWTARLNLRDWDVRYDPLSPVDDGSWASCDSRTTEKVAVIVVDPSVPDSDLELTVVHEVLHLVLNQYADLVGPLIVPAMGVGAGIYTEVLEDAQETVIETIARALLPKAPRLTVGTGPRWDHWRLWKR